MNSTTNKPPNRKRFLIAGALALAALVGFGAWYLFGGYQTGEITTWDIQAILESDEVVTYEDVLWKLPLRNVEDFDAYLAYYYKGEPRSEAIAQLMSRIDIEWKGESRDLSRCQLTFTIRGAHPMEIQRIAPWTDGQIVRVYCDEQGGIIGWDW